VAATQAGRPFEVSTPLGADVLLAERFEGEEAISAPFEYRVRMLSENDLIAASSLLRKPLTITMRLANGRSRYINGIVRRFVQVGRRHKYTAYEATIAPWFWFLSLDQDCRIFQRKTVQQIVEAVFQAAGYADFQFKLYRSYSVREYCVQYRETSLNFVSRLLEQEGIFYFFQHSENQHTMIITDSAPGITACPNQSSFDMAPEGGPTINKDVITQLDRQQRVGTGTVTLNDYNFETPSTDLKVTMSSPEKNEIYDYPGKHSNRREGERYSRIRLEEQEATLVTVAGASNCRAMVAGYKFEVNRHYRPDMNQTYLLTWLRQTMGSSEYAGAGDLSGGVDYSNEFKAIPFSTPYRPPRTSREAVVMGPQTAVVVGPAGEEIYTDKYGRVKVQFHWDRVGGKNENSSCWVRVSQTWAGKTWGGIQIPRIGQEVIVDFLEGDPDRPIITGRVYNADQTVPYSLPDNQTQSGLKSRSSKGGSSDNYNEIRIEDKKGSELILVHAEKDLTTEVENDEVRQVGRNRTTTIKNNETKTVEEGDETHTVKMGKHTVTVQRDQIITIKQGNQTTMLEMGNQSTELKMGNQSTKVDLGQISSEALQSIELKVGQSSIRIDQMGVTIKGMMINIEGQIQVQVKGLMTQVNGDAMLKMQGGITLIN
jgi:type VI secretion system secreted protein VgrG